MHKSRNRCCDICENCRIPDEDVISISTISTSSTATIDNKAGAGRGLDQLFQYLGGHLERRTAVVLDRLGFGPAAVERRALRIIEELRSKIKHVKQWRKRGRGVLRVTTASEMKQLQKELDKCCMLLVNHLQFVL
jgi:hypothetical protein